MERVDELDVRNAVNQQVIIRYAGVFIEIIHQSHTYIWYIYIFMCTQVNENS